MLVQNMVAEKTRALPKPVNRSTSQTSWLLTFDMRPYWIKPMGTLWHKWLNRIQYFIHFCQHQRTGFHGMMPTDQLHEHLSKLDQLINLFLLIHLKPRTMESFFPKIVSHILTKIACNSDTGFHLLIPLPRMATQFFYGQFFFNFFLLSFTLSASFL